VWQSPEVIIFVVDDTEQEFEINRKSANIDKVLNDLSVGRYGTVVTTSVQTPTVRFANYMALLEAIKMGVPIPPDLLAEASDWPMKEKIVKGIQANMQAQAQARQQDLQEKEKDRQIKIAEIREKTSGDLLKDAQKAQLDAVTNYGKEKKDGNGKQSNRKD
jgi:hypothetical protein